MKTKLFLFLTFFSFFVNAQVSQQERQALIDFYNATDGDNWTNNTNWDTDPNSTSDVSTWFGVTTVNSNGQEYVARLFLNSNNLVGNLPDFKNLTKLLRLEIANNTISGEIDINKLPLTLNVLQLSSNQITGSIPDLTPFTNLLHIQLTRNKFVGNVSEKLFPSSIQTISIGYNDISGTLDFRSFPDLRTIIPAESNISFLKFPSNGIISSVFNSTTSFSVKNMPNLAFIEVPNVSGFTNLREEYFDLGLRIVDYDQADQTATPNANEREALKKLYENKSYTYASTIKSDINDTEWLEIEVINGETRVTEIHATNLAVNGEMPTEIGVFTELTHLHIPSSGINTIATELKNVTKLEELYLNNNSITEIPSDFYDLVKLKTLNLNNNQIPSIANGLGNFIDLEELYFSNTQVDVIPTTIGNLKKLQILEFANTRITLLPPEIGGLIELTRLVAAPNNIASIPSEFGQLTKLQFLDFANCELSNTPAAFANLTELQTLFLNDNELQVVVGLGGFTKLKFLRLHNNRLGEDNPNFNTDLPEDMSDLVDLEELTLYNNKLTKLPANIGNLNKLTELRLENNRLTNLPESIGNIISLQQLTLDNNNLKSLPTTIGALSNLKILQLTGNELTSLPNEIGDLSNLENLSIGQQSKVENNETIRTLTAVPATLTNLAKLTSFSASSNKITGLVDLSGINTLRFISLENNEITDLKLGEVPTGVSTTYRIQQNPFITCVEVPTSQITIWEQRLQRDNGVAISDNCTGFRVPQKERQALIDFYNATGGGDTWEGTNWDNDPTRLTNVGSWAGITTEVVNSQKHVTKINITQFIGITGQITGDIASSIKDLEELTELIISSTNSSLNADIESLPSEIGLLSKLVKINLQRNKLSSLPNEIGDLPLLEELNVQENELTSLPSGIGNAVALKNLYVRNQSKVNPTTGSEQTLTSLPNEIGNINTLEILDVSSNILATLPSTIGDLDNLEDLTLDNNNLKSLPTTIGALSNLKILQLTGNELTSLPNEIGDLSNLENLSIGQQSKVENNETIRTLTAVPATLTNLAKLTSFSASSNKITGLVDLSGINTLRFISLENNEITDLKLGEVPTGVSTTYRIQQNPFITCVEVPTSQITIWEQRLQRDNGVAISDNCTGFRVPQKERQALIDFYNATGGGDTWEGTNWDNDPTRLTNVGSWAGITTEVVNSQKHVTKINITQFIGITGQITGDIASSIKDLEELTELIISSTNSSLNADIESLPSEIGLLSKLVKINLQRNKLSSLPNEIGDLPLLEELNVLRK
ncbi:leucine-rich repeat domain-containing protein [Polaribacter sp. MED152]|uniref:leucine-rich repeat domain-containing protein n=1 Tax=Polaribacter sp. MED152 TaxID=313598 RepID=UPI000068C84D|nr:leucine-rich repeat domain-containing protein [Polaribacter sp. MED152]EAQ43240.1 leucine-rich repeat (LRR) protein [Polaribacter sp. MED152]